MKSFSEERCELRGGAMQACMDAVAHVSPSEPQWYALQVRPRCEKKAESQLRRKGVETYLPVIRQVRWWSDRRKTVEIPLFSGYEFVRIQLSPAKRLLVLQTNGVMNFVGFPSGATPVTPAQIESLRRLLASDSECSIRPFLRTGQKVRIRGGALEGVEGFLQEDSAKHLVVSIDCIQRSIAIRIEGYDLEAV